LGESDVDPETDLAVAERLLDEGDAVAALRHAKRAQERIAKALTPQPLWLGMLAGRLIDCGGDLHRADLVREGLTILESEYELLATVIERFSLQYNIGNAKKSLHDLEAAQRREFNPASIVLLTEAKDHYWQALQLADEREPQLLVNLANALDQCCRAAEALRYYDEALALRPGFPMAHLNRGEALLLLNRLSGTFTVSQLAEAKRSFRLAETSQIPPHLRSAAREKRLFVSHRLEELGWSDERSSAYDEQHRLEASEHDAYWQFCLDHYLALSEHSLYCRCVGARRDDLTIPKPTGPIAGEFVPRLELLLNRVKSEFCLARALYYQGIQPVAGWAAPEFEGTFSELHEKEAIGLAPEFLRTSFRLCFGVLDKLALGLSELYGLAEADEPLPFESFWRPRDQRQKGEPRWTKLNQQHNWGLVALYSIATDLNSKKGQWGFFKKHRNSLEHGLLVLLERGAQDVPAIARPERVTLETLPMATFRAHTLHMLQLTASAIFSFVFCVREEGLRALSSTPGLQVTVDKKDVGKE
jgi:tetratricopeptide (TPR) repeat protein